MQLKYICSCGYHNIWKIRFDKISDFVCVSCQTFHASCNGKEIRFVEPTERDKFSLVDDESRWGNVNITYGTGTYTPVTNYHYYTGGNITTSWDPI